MIEAAHDPEVAGSNPAPATSKGPGNGPFAFWVNYALSVSACSHSRQATERLSDSRRREPAPVAGLRPPQERLKQRLWRPGSRLESQRRVALPADRDTSPGSVDLRSRPPATCAARHVIAEREQRSPRPRLRSHRTCRNQPKGPALTRERCGEEVVAIARREPVTSGGKSRSRESGGITPKPLPWVATGCRLERMVKRRSISALARLPRACSA
jgi:hypothetical protein